MSPFSIGLLIVLAGAVMQGSWALPQKFVRGWAWEKMWLLYSVAAMIVFPWLFVSLMIPRAGEAYASVSTGVLVRTALFGAGWGLGSVLFGLGIAAVGLALGFAIIISLTAALGTLVPMAILHPERFTFQRGGLLILGLLVVIAGVSLCAKAGAIKDAGASATKGNFTRGLLICIASGIASPMFNFGFAFGTPIQSQAVKLGANEDYASIALLAVITTAGFVVNAGYCVYLLVRNRSWAKGLNTDRFRNLGCAIAMGFMWLLGFFLYGIGSSPTRMGPLGSSVGWAILMTTMVLVANVWGLLTGEWKNVEKRAFRYLGGGLALLVVALAVIGLSSS
jgi:L-rhamnose-H+ transport protein